MEAAATLPNNSPPSLLLSKARAATHAPVPRAALDLWHPQSGQQARAFACDADQIGYGGAAGGGKTDLALGLSLRRHRRSIIFRREMPNARGIIERSREIIGGHGRFNETLKIWRIGNQLIEIGSMPNEADKFDHQGQARDLHVFDESTEFSESQVRFVIGWNRSADPNQHCQVLLTFNPPLDESQEWVIAFFAPWLQDGYPDPAADGELRYVVMGDDGTETFHREPPDAPHKSRTFFRATLSDNPALMATGYADTIAALPEPLRSALRGTFNVARGVDIWQVIPKSWVEAAMARWTPDAPQDCTAMGLDVARGGDDETVLARKHGARWFAALDIVPGRLTPDGGSAAQVVIARHPGAGVPVGVDVIGVGGSAHDHLLGAGMASIALNASEGTTETDKSGKLLFANRRALWWWRMREALDPVHGDTLALPPDDALKAELCAPRWSLRGQRILVESKDDIKKRLRRSTNRADAVIMAQGAASDSAVVLFGA